MLTSFRHSDSQPFVPANFSGKAQFPSFSLVTFIVKIKESERGRGKEAERKSQCPDSLPDDTDHKLPRHIKSVEIFQKVLRTSSITKVKLLTFYMTIE